MKRIYIAGPINADNALEFLDNVSQGVQAATLLLRLGYAPFCPHLDFLFRLQDSRITREMYHAYSIAWVPVSDAVLALPGWKDSAGARKEIDLAIKNRIPVCYSIRQLKDFLRLIKNIA